MAGKPPSELVIGATRSRPGCSVTCCPQYGGQMKALCLVMEITADDAAKSAQLGDWDRVAEDAEQLVDITAKIVQVTQSAIDDA
jgi:hypothetical protein